MSPIEIYSYLIGSVIVNVSLASSSSQVALQAILWGSSYFRTGLHPVLFHKMKKGDLTAAFFNCVL